MLGKRVRALRAEAGLSQERLAHDCGLHPTYVSGIERGVRNPGVLNVLALARALGVDPSELLQGVRL
jgi:transcriptional regulator with XRE-family HTH domain